MIRAVLKHFSCCFIPPSLVKCGFSWKKAAFAAAASGYTYRKNVLAAFLAAASLAGAQQTTHSPENSPGPNAQVLFSRSLDDVSASTDSTASKTDGSPEKGQNAPSQKDANAPAQNAGAMPAGQIAPIESALPKITFLSYNLDIHVRPKQQALAVRAQIALRNDGARPVQTLPLQISSGLSWIGVQVDGGPAPFTRRLVDSDTDHTGMLNEAEVKLPSPLASGQTISLDVSYQGVIPLTGERLQQVGASAQAAQRSDWDRIDSNFVGLRGFGNVVWYPVVTAPVLLGDGNRFFSEIGEQKLRQSGAMVSMRVTEEFFGAAPNLAVLDGNPLPLTPLSLPQNASLPGALPGIATAMLPKTRLGFATPSLFLLTRTESTQEGLHLYALPDDISNEGAYTAAAKLVAPVIGKWLRDGRPEAPSEAALSIVDLPEASDSPFEQGSVLFLALQAAQPSELAVPLIHALTRADFQSPYPWLDEGVAYFMATLWVEQNHGRETALREMNNDRAALSLAEPAPGRVTGGNTAATATNNGAGEPLLAAKDPIYYRVKATYVLWMLRDLAGDDALAKALCAYNPAADHDGRELERVLERTSGQNLGWFFSDWVYHDRGLPDLSIAGVYPSTSSIADSYIVAVNVVNHGSAAADVPVSVRSEGATVTARLRVPANSNVAHRFLLSGYPVAVSVNDGSVPEVEASIHRMTISHK